MNALINNICCLKGKRCSCDFIFNGETITKSGILERIEGNTLVLKSTKDNNKILFCSLERLQFITIEL